MKKIFSLILAILISSMSFGVVAFAETTSSTNENVYTTETVTNSTSLSGSDNNSINVDGGVPVVTIDDATSWVERKGFEIVKFLQTVVQPFAIIIFIGCAFLALIGAFGNSSLIGRGVSGMLIAVIMYAVVLFSPEILGSIINWLQT